MPNGTGLLGNSSSTQSAVVVGWPGRDSLYYLFTVDFNAGPNGLNYSIVNINSQNGLGDVVVKNTQLYTPTCEKITAVLHENGRDVWVLSHKWGTDEFYTYLITDQGLQIIPRIQAIGNIHTGNVGNSIGYMKAAPNGDKIGLIIRNDGIAQVFDFDKRTGVLSNPITLNPNLGAGYGLEFSPDGNLLYVSFRDIAFLDNFLYQYDLRIPGQFINQLAVVIEHVVRPNIFTSDGLGSIQLTPNEKIFITRPESRHLSSIEFPNTVGLGCSFVDTSIFLANRQGMLGLPTFNQSYFRPIDIVMRNTCIGDSASVFLTDTLGIDSV